MFAPNSRYYAIAVATLTLTDPDGQQRDVRFVRRRFVPDLSRSATLVEHAVTQGERIDNLTARYVSDPTLYWQVCDANDVLRPIEATQRPGRILRLALPGF
jgi:hypothetical protein